MKQSRRSQDVIFFARSASAPVQRSRGHRPLRATLKPTAKDEKTKSRYRETEEVKTFYRVNRYPS